MKSRIIKNIRTIIQKIKSKILKEGEREGLGKGKLPEQDLITQNYPAK